MSLRRHVFEDVLNGTFLETETHLDRVGETRVSRCRSIHRPRLYKTRMSWESLRYASGSPPASIMSHLSLQLIHRMIVGLDLEKAVPPEESICEDRPEDGAQVFIRHIRGYGPGNPVTIVVQLPVRTMPVDR